MITDAGPAPGTGITPALMTNDQACEYLQVHVSTLREWAARHRIKSVKIRRGQRGGVRWRKTDLDRLIDLSTRK